MTLANENADRDALRKIRSTYEDALNTRDLEKIQPLLADGFTGVVVSGDEVKCFEDMRTFMNKVWDMLGKGGRYHVKVVVDHTDLFGDLAVSRGANEERFHMAAGKEFAFSAPWTVVARRQHGKWKIFRVHACLNPMENVIVTEIVRRNRVLYGAYGLGLGLALGLVLRSFWCKKV
jgi:ketosteroid isomerase-like protein